MTNLTKKTPSKASRPMTSPATAPSVSATSLAATPSASAAPLALTATPQPLSPKEKAVLEFLEVYIHGHGFSPTYQEICDHFGFASFNSVQRYLKQLEAKQYVQLPWGNQKRAITILRPSSAVRDSLDSIAPQTHVETVVRQPHADKLSNVSPAILNNASLQLPLLGRVAAGVPLEAYEHDEFIDVPASLVRHAERTYALRVQGDSMIDDGILDGDVILVQRQSTAQNGDIVVAVINEEATVKRFYKHTSHSSTDHAKGGSSGRAGQIELRPANATMSPMWFDANQVQLRGVVVGLIRRFS